MTRRLSFVSLLLLTFTPVGRLLTPVAGQSAVYQLANGTVEREGRVERLNAATQQYETVCDGFWDLNAADVFCKSQGLGFAVQPLIGPRFGAGTGRIWGAPKCDTGDEGSLDECTLNTTAVCSHSHDAGVICSGPLDTGSNKIGFIRIYSNRRSNKYDGLPQIALSGGFAFFCFGAVDQASAEVTCRSAGYQRLVQYGRVNIIGTAVDLGSLLTKANCSGDEVNLKSCTLTIGQTRCEDNALQHIECEAPAETVPSLGSSIGAVRLSGGNVAREGRVEVRRNGTWQSVCANQWQWLASNLVCKSMNMGYALAWYTDSLYQGGGSLRVSPPLLCTPGAGNFSDCFELIPPSPADCTAEDDEVGVVCSGSGLELSQKNILRLVGGTTLYNGAVEWKQHAGPGQGWTPFASTSWSDAHSRVACRALGFTTVAGAHYTVSRSRSPSTCVSSLTCSGSEGTLGECTGLGLRSHCGLQVVGIQCAGPLEMFTLTTPTPSATPPPVVSPTRVITVNDTITADPVYAVPINVVEGKPPNLNLGELSICYEIHGDADKWFNFISDKCLSLNALYREGKVFNRTGHVIRQLAILSEDDTGMCKQVLVMMDDDGMCSVTVDGTEVNVSNSGGLRVNKNRNRVRVSVPNCDNHLVVMWASCEDFYGTRMMRLVVSRGLNLRPTSHGFLGQFWNVDVALEKFNETYDELLKQMEGPHPHYIVHLRPPDPAQTRSFVGELYTTKWDNTHEPCIYVGSNQAGTGRSDLLPLGTVVEGAYSDYIMGGAFEYNYQFTRFESESCMQG